MSWKSWQAAMVLGGTLAASCTGCRRTAEVPAAGSSSASAAASLVRVAVGAPQRKTLIVTTTLPARIEAFEETPLYAKLAGFIQEVHVDIGDRVSDGQALVTLDIPELADDVTQKEALLAQAEAEVAQAVANVKAVQAAAETARAKIAEAKAGISRAAANYERWRGEYDRIKELAGRGSVTEKLSDETFNQFQAAAAAQDEASAMLQSAAAAADEAAANVAKAEADKLASDAQIHVARADLARARTMLAYATISSPFEGVITQRTVDTGHFVQPAGGASAKPLLVVARSDKVRVFLEIPEMQAGLVDVGDEVALTIQALGSQQLAGPVARTSWSLESANRSLRAEVDLAKDIALLRPGMYATGTIQLDRRDDVLVLPAAAIFRTGGEAFCSVVVSDAVDHRKLKLGLQSGSEIEVIEGVDEGDVVVLARGETLAQGQRVEVSGPTQ